MPSGSIEAVAGAGFIISLWDSAKQNQKCKNPGEPGFFTQYPRLGFFAMAVFILFTTSAGAGVVASNLWTYFNRLLPHGRAHHTGHLLS